jgi:hypothetical protein
VDGIGLSGIVKTQFFTMFASDFDCLTAANSLS